MIRSVVLLALLAVVLAGCFGESEPTTAETHRGQSSPTGTELATKACPVTLPNGSVPADATDWGPNDSYGNGKLWTLFWPYNLVIADSGYVEEDGAIRMKWPWWRGVNGELRIHGRRLDAKSPPLTADSSSTGYGLSGFLPAEIFFPTEGCWEVTGTVADAKLTFVTFVVKASTYGLKPEYE